MSSSSPAEQPLEKQVSNESDVVFEVSLSLNKETLNQTPKSDLEINHSPHPIPDPEENSAADEEEEEEADDEGEEQETLAISSGMPITERHVSISDVTITSPPDTPNPRRGGAKKRKKGKSKAKAKGKPSIKKQQAIDEKFQALSKKLNPIPFLANKILDFAKHEKLLKRLGLWDFVHITFDRDVRADLIARLVASYGVSPRVSYVKDCRINVNRADLARALKLPMKKEKGRAGVVEVDSDWEPLSGESIGFVVEFVSDWVLLHEDMWMMPNEVIEWLKVIKDGHPEKVDWAGLFWFMVEKELKKGDQLTDCYYASHLQHLMKFQRGEKFFIEEPAFVDVELNAEFKEEDEEEEQEEEEDDDAVNLSLETNDCAMEGPSTELTLGQDSENEDELKDAEMVDAEKDEEIDEAEEEDDQEPWLMHGKNNMGEHFMQRCNAEKAGDYASSEEEEIGEEENEEEPENQFHGFPTDEDGFTGNLLQTMEATHMGFASQNQLYNPSLVNDVQHIASTPSFFNDMGKRVIGHDNHIPHNDSNKRLRLGDSLWDHSNNNNNNNNNKPVDFGMCMEQIQQMTERARMFYEEKEQNLARSNMSQQVLLEEVHKRDSVIADLHKARFEETQKKDGEIYRLEREIYMMGGVLEGYRKALKDVSKSFAEYKERARLPEEPTYKDVESGGGLMLTGAEIERLRKKKEEEYKMSCLILEQKVKELGVPFLDQFNGFAEKVDLLDKRLAGIEANGKGLLEMYAKRKLPKSEEELPKVDEPLQITPQPEELVPEVEESVVPIEETEEKVPVIAEPSLPNE
ncbi:hypothetical protein ABFX02_13G034700 [Erythranthe guttata]